MSSPTQRAYAEARARSQQIALLRSTLSLLEWDEETNMPAAGLAHRSEQVALLAGLEHERLLDPAFGELLERLEGQPELSHVQALNVREWRRRHRRAARLEAELVRAVAKATALAQHAWADARREGRFELLAPLLDEVVGLKRQEAAAIGFEHEAYDALLEEHEPGMRARELEPLFAALERALAPRVKAARARAAQVSPAPLEGRASLERQLLLCRRVCELLGFDLRAGRLDTSEHPFTTQIGPGDTRITTRFDEGDFSRGLLSLLHELGHAFYDQGLPSEHFGTPAGEAPSAGMHEANARLWENFVGRSRGFWRLILPWVEELLAVGPRELEQVYRALHRVGDTTTRVHADELSYNLHVLVRFELERALIRGSLAVRELPQAFREAYGRVLDLDASDEAEGVLHDGHWAAGMFGYFPTYTLGNVAAAQLFAAAEQELGPQDPSFAAGDFRGLLGWLRARIHTYGHLDSTRALVEKASGRPLGPEALVAHLSRLLAEVYGIGE